MNELRRRAGQQRQKLNVRVDPEQQNYILDRAAELGESFSRMARMILQLGIKADKRRKRKQERGGLNT